MTYDAKEKSADGGRPVELYTFSRGANLVWRYTSADRDLTVASQLYTAQEIQRGGIQQGREAQRSNMRLTVAHDLAVAALYKIAPPSDPISLVLQQYHYGDGELKTIWQGDILGVAFDGPQATIELQPLSGGFGSLGLVRYFQRQCPHDLYGAGCKLDPATFRVTGTVASLSGLTVNVAAADALADGHFNGGYIEWEVATDTYDRRFIVSHVGAVLTLDVQPLGLTATTAVRMYPGCDHTIETCAAKFSNNLNYGGMPYIPTKNPFGSDPLY